VRHQENLEGYDVAGIAGRLRAEEVPEDQLLDKAKDLAAPLDQTHQEGKLEDAGAELAARLAHP